MKASYFSLERADLLKMNFSPKVLDAIRNAPQATIDKLTREVYNQWIRDYAFGLDYIINAAIMRHFGFKIEDLAAE